MATPDFDFYPNTGNAGSSIFTLVSFRGKEAISALFEFKITVKITSADDSSAVFDGNFVFTMRHGSSEKNYGGVVARYKEVNPSGATAGYKYYEATFVPHLWSRTLGIRSQIYVRKTVDEILEEEIAEITAANGNVEIEKSLVGRYPSRPFTCQYKENNFNFMSRMMEHYGIYSYFEHGGNPGEVAKLVLADDAAYESISRIKGSGSRNTLSYTHPAPNGDVFFSSIHELLSGVVTIEDGVRVHGDNPDQPSSPFDATYPNGAAGTITQLASENPVSQEDADLIAEARYQHLDIYTKRWKGRSGICRLAPGYTFNTAHVPTPSLLLIIEVEHAGLDLDQSFGGSGGTATYSNTFKCVDGTKQYRPPRLSTLPQANNIETGTIYADQTNTTLAEIDSDGRYRVEFNFLPGTDNVDGASSEADKQTVSHWVRMSQSAAGPSDGIFVPLKPGVEVTIAFIGSNPDRPIITGALSNASYPSRVTSQNSNEAVLATQGLLSLVSLEGSYRYSKTRDAELPQAGDTTPVDFSDHTVKEIGVNPNPRNQNINNQPDKVYNPGVSGAVLSDADEISGDYHIQRRYGDLYTKIYGNDIKAHYGNTYDYGSNWTYGFGNGYGETHLEYESTVNKKKDDDLLNIGGPDWASLLWPSSGPAENGVSPSDFNLPHPELWTNGNVWVSKTYGANLAKLTDAEKADLQNNPLEKPKPGGLSYSYSEGDAISVNVNSSVLNITRGSGQVVIDAAYRGGNGSIKSWSRTGPMPDGKYGTKTKKWNGSKKRTYESESTFKGKSNNNFDTTSNEKKYNKDGQKFYDKSESFDSLTGITDITETKWNYLLGDTLPFYAFTKAYETGEIKTNHAFNSKGTVDTSINMAATTSASINMGASASASINLDANASFALNVSGTIAISISFGLDFSLKTGASAGIDLDLTTGVVVQLDNSNELKVKGRGFKARKKAALEAEKEDLKSRSTMLAINRIVMGLDKNDIKIQGATMNLETGLLIHAG